MVCFLQLEDNLNKGGIMTVIRKLCPIKKKDHNNNLSMILNTLIDTK